MESNSSQSIKLKVGRITLLFFNLKFEITLNISKLFSSEIYILIINFAQKEDKLKDDIY